MKKRGETRLSIGPTFPVVRSGDFSKLRLTPDQWSDAWRLCGPSAERNMNGPRPAPLWIVIAAAYLEGLNHGAALARETPRATT